MKHASKGHQSAVSKTDDPRSRAGPQDDVITGFLSRDPSEPASNLGTQVPNIEEPDDDEQEVEERLVAEGVEKAERDLLNASRRRPTP